MRNFQKLQGLILYPVFGGTLLESDVKFEPTDYLSVPLSLPSLRPEDIETIIKEEKVTEFYTSRYKSFWNLVGVVSRHLNGHSKVDELVSQGRIYKINQHIGLPPAFIDKFSETNTEIPKKLLSDFVYSSNKPLWEIFEELCLKTITCKLNYMFKLTSKYTKVGNNIITLPLTIGDIFYGAHIPNSISSVELSSSIPASNYFSFTTIDETVAKVIKKSISTSSVTKTKKNQKGIDGFLPELTSRDRKILFVIQNKFLNFDSQDRTITPQDLKQFYDNALIEVKNYDVYVLIFTNKRASKATIKRKF